MNIQSIDLGEKPSGYLFPRCQQADDLLQTFGRLPAYAIFRVCLYYYFLHFFPLLLRIHTR